MKKRLMMMLALVLVGVTSFAMVACGSSLRIYSLADVFGADKVPWPDENLGFLVRQDTADQVALRAEINRVIADLKDPSKADSQGRTKLDQLSDYFIKLEALNRQAQPSVNEMPSFPSSIKISNPNAKSVPGAAIIVGTEVYGFFSIFLKKDLANNIMNGVSTFAGYAVDCTDTVDSSDATPYMAGLDVAIMTIVANNLGRKLTVYNMTWSDVTSLHQYSRDISTDVGFGSMTILLEREVNGFKFSDSYLASRYAFIAAKSANLNAAKLKGKKIGVQNGTTAYDNTDPKATESSGYLMDLVNNGAISSEDDIYGYTSAQDAYQALKNGNVDIVFTEETIAKSLIAK